MKKQIFTAIGLLGLIGFILTGCSQEKTSTDTKKEAKPAIQKEVTNKPDSKPKKDEEGNVILTEVGHKTTDEDGTIAELLKIKMVNQSVDIAPVKLTVQDLKVIQLTKISKSYKEFLLQFTNGSELPEKLNYIQINYTAENTEDTNVGWNGIDKIVTNTGEQLDASGGDIIWEEGGFDGTFYGKTKHEGTIGVITKSNPSELTSLKLIIDSSFNPDSYEDITAQQQAEFQF